uniref:Uncharacterized protein n=1 Tax=Steinernema glaseri TaxID=37863 RepID=A0A1I8AQP2_9BILA
MQRGNRSPSSLAGLLGETPEPSALFITVINATSSPSFRTSTISRPGPRPCKKSKRSLDVHIKLFGVNEP